MSNVVKDLVKDVVESVVSTMTGPLGKNTIKNRKKRAKKRAKKQNQGGQQTTQQRSFRKRDNPQKKQNGRRSRNKPADKYGGETIITTREVEYPVLSSNAFSYRVMLINPADNYFAPWLAPIGSCYEQFRVVSMTARYVSLSANIVTNNLTNGEVAMDIDYDVKDQAPDSMEAIERSLTSSFGPINRNLVIRYNRPTQGDQFKYYDTLPFNAVYSGDLSTYYPGALRVAVRGTPSGQDGQRIGRVVVQATFAMIRPRFEQSGLQFQYSSHIVAVSPTSSNPFGSASIRYGSTQYISVDEVNKRLVVAARTPPGACFRITQMILCSSGAVTAPNITPTTGTMLKIYFGDSGQIAYAPTLAATSSSMMCDVIYQVPLAGLTAPDYITWSGFTLPTVSQAEIFISGWDNSVVNASKPSNFSTIVKKEEELYQFFKKKLMSELGLTKLKIKEEESDEFSDEF